MKKEIRHNSIYWVIPCLYEAEKLAKLSVVIAIRATVIYQGFEVNIVNTKEV